MAQFIGFILVPVVLLLIARHVVNGECLDDGSMLDGAWNYAGVNGTYADADPPRYDENNIGMPNPTWTIPDGVWSYAQGEMGDYGEVYFTQHTCTILQFCNPESAINISVVEDDDDDDDNNNNSTEADDEDAVWGCYRGGKCMEGGHACCDCDIETEDACAESGKEWDMKPIWTDGCESICARRKLEKFYRRVHRHLLSLDESSEQPIYRMSSKEHFDDCDFTDATLIGTTGKDTCVEIPVDDLVMDGTKSYYSSTKEGCMAGQKLAVVTADYESTANQCAAIASHVPASSRVRGCDCSFEKNPFAARYGALCAYAYQNACYDIMMPADSDCCDTETCNSKMEMFDNEYGKQHELDRREECDDAIPGNCYNADGKASDLSQDGSTDCCTQTCSTCGSELATGAVWESCTSNDPNTMTATCGRLSRYAQDDYVCDFSKCPTDSYWGTANTPIYTYMGIGPAEAAKNSSYTNGGESNGDHTGDDTEDESTTSTAEEETEDDISSASYYFMVTTFTTLCSSILGGIVTTII